MPFANMAIQWETYASIATIPMVYRDYKAKPVVLDSGAGVNIISSDLYKRWGQPPLENVSFVINLADQTRKAPMGIIRDIPVLVGGLKFAVTFVILDVPKVLGAYFALLRRPGMRASSLVQNWGGNYVKIWNREEMIRYDLGN